MFREDDDDYDEKHSGFSVARIVAIIAAVVVLAFFIYKVASLSGQVTKLNEQIETYKTMETEYEQMKLDNLSLTEQVESLKDQLAEIHREKAQTARIRKILRIQKITAQLRTIIPEAYRRIQIQV